MRPEDAAEIHDFVRSRWTRLVRTAYLLTGDHGEAEDLAQTTLAVPVPNTPEGFVVFVLGPTAAADARGATYTFTAYDAQGAQVDQDTFPNNG